MSDRVAAGTTAPLFSVLLPSRDRLELLKHAIGSVLRQDVADVEVVVADNASSENYAAYVASLADPRIRHLRCDAPIPVTDNWNRALAAARGRYIVIIGDDDALSPGYLSRSAALIDQFGQPDVVQTLPYYYAYPRVFATAPAGFLAMLKPLPYDDPPRPAHLMDIAEARRVGRLALRFRHRFGFTSQHFVWSRAFIDRLAGQGPFFQSPYPDFYAAFMTMLRADTIVVGPDPGVMIGISTKSYGYFLHSHDLGAGDDLLMIRGRGYIEAAGAGSPAAQRALAFPGSWYYRHWLTAALTAAQRLADDGTWVDFRRYRRIQLFDMAYRRWFLQQRDAAPGPELWASLSRIEQSLFDHLSWTFRAMRRARSFSGETAYESLLVLHGIYRDAVVTHYGLERHRNITDAWNWLATDNTGSVSLPFLHVAPTRQVVDTIRIERMMGDMGFALSSKDLHISKLDVLLRGKDAQIRMLNEMVRTRERVFGSPARLILRGLLLAGRTLRKAVAGRR